jgi:hypothetical protein
LKTVEGSHSVDEYSRSGPKSPKAASRERERERLHLMERLLELEDERDFLEELEKQLDILPKHPAYKAALMIWRERHPSR